MWRRDIATAKNWSDTSVLTCQARPASGVLDPAPVCCSTSDHLAMPQDCGESNHAHDDCGKYDLDDPPEPCSSSFHGDDFKTLKGVTSAF
jgi:hypothetical protein